MPTLRESDAPLDVAVIGAGPAGATAARLLASWGHTVALIGRAPPRRTLGESLPPSCTKLFDELGVRSNVDAAGFVRATGNTVRWANGETRVERFESGVAGYQVSRDAFDALLVAAATSRSGIIHHGATVVDVARSPDDRGDTTWRVAFESDAGREVVGARWMLDCSGRAGVVARHGLRRAAPGARTMAIAGTWERDGGWPVAEETHTLVESYEGGWAWSVPVSARRRYITMMLDPALTPLPGRAQLAAAYDAELARTTMLRELVACRDANLIKQPWGLDASPYSATRAFDDHTLLIGDSASFVDPLSSFGVKKALASAWLGSVVVHTALTEAAMTSSALELFADRELAMFEHLQRQSALLARDAAGTHSTEFWASRSDVDGEDGLVDLDDATARTDPRERQALDELRRRPSIQLRRGASCTLVDRPLVRGNRVVLEPHLATPEWPRGSRFRRNIDLLRIVELAPHYDQVPDLYDAYNRMVGRAALPEFLGALSSLIGLEVLVLAT